MNTTLRWTFLSIALMVLLLAPLSLAQIPKTISYQGILTDASGTAVPDGNYSLTFKLYDVATGGTHLWAEGQLVAVSKGIFSVILGSATPLNLHFNKPYWLGVTVGAGTELTPRMQLTSSGYSFRAANTDSINGITAGGDLTGTYPNPSIKNNAVTSAKLADQAVTQAKLAPGVSIPPGGSAGGDLTGTYPNPTIKVPLSLSGSSSSAIISGSNSGSGYGVHGYSSSGYAEYFRGNVQVTGTLSKGAGSFKIDHPLEPAGKYLYHSFVESPDMMNIYNGNVVADANGEATVTLPDYFETLNRDFRYQLTVIGQFAQAIVSEEIHNNRFTIKTDKPNVRVSWQVTGIRHDPFAESHRIQVEVEKTGKERGKYLHPKEYGVSESLGIDYEEIHKMEEEQAKAKTESLKMQAKPEAK